MVHFIIEFWYISLLNCGTFHYCAGRFNMYVGSWWVSFLNSAMAERLVGPTPAHVELAMSHVLSLFQPCFMPASQPSACPG